MIVAIRGGLGNQLFQAAFAQYLKLQGNEVYLDTRDYPVHDRIYMLERCGFDFPVATPMHCEQALWRAKTKAGRISHKALARILKKKTFPGMVREPHKWHFSPELAHYPDLSYFDGYWMSYSYAEEGKCQFPFVHTPPPETLKIWEERLQAPHSVAVHIRRGDYAENAAIRKDYFVCDLDYFHRAMQQLTEKIPSCTFTLFSDDPAYIASQNWAPFDVKILPDFPEVGDEQIMRLFSKAHHQIISNSTYSWWGAFLNDRAGKQVFAPDHWRTNMPSHSLQGHMLPPEWTLIPTTG
ncbi:alpha-1,2-fucosyltransferase [Kiritimatiellota bacterium B12222]|nr:alpha-1,2-fucosyltransferase [Kiritimatiellota bacterium B12222]